MAGFIPGHFELWGGGSGVHAIAGDPSKHKTCFKWSYENVLQYQHVWSAEYFKKLSKNIMQNSHDHDN